MFKQFVILIQIVLGKDHILLVQIIQIMEEHVVITH